MYTEYVSDVKLIENCKENENIYITFSFRKPK